MHSFWLDLCSDDGGAGRLDASGCAEQPVHAIKCITSLARWMPL